MTVPPPGDKAQRPMPRLLKVDPISGEILGQAPAPGPHSIDVIAAEEASAGGCCGGFFWLRAAVR
jgi:hypothetical protein